MPEIPARFLRRTWVRRALPAGVAAVLVVAGTAMTRANATASPINTYRTTTVTTGSVQQRLNVTGSVQRVNQVSQSFAVAGTVTSVAVSVGDAVTTGQALATIDPVPLRRSVTAAQASLAKAKATAESDQTATTSATKASGTGDTASASTVTPARTATPTISPRVAGPSGRSGAGTDKSLAQAQQSATNAQKAISADLGQASAALAQCVPFFPPGSPSARATPAQSPTSPATTTTSPPSPGGAAPTTPATATTTPSDAAITACLSALRTVPTQQQIRVDQQALTRSQGALMTSVTLAITTAGSTTAPGTASSSAAAGQPSAGLSTTSQSAGGLSSGGQSSGGQTGGTGQSSASRVISDQAAVSTAENALSSAQANLPSATLKSSIAGTVGSVTLASGASSGGMSIVIVGTGAVAVTVNVPLASMANVRVGQKANVTPQGATTSAPGTVTSISLLPSTTSSTSSTAGGKATAQGAGTGTGTGTGQASATSSSPVYPAVILVPDALPALASGSRADVSLLIGTASNVLNVPNSALTPLGNGQALALTFKNGVATRAIVKTGFAGTLATQVTSGLTAGQQVVLADLSTALPTNTTNSRRFGMNGATAGGLGGSGLGGSGLGGGAVPGGAGFTPRG